jgi:hypothetical protein
LFLAVLVVERERGVVALAERQAQAQRHATTGAVVVESIGREVRITSEGLAEADAEGAAGDVGGIAIAQPRHRQ